MSFDSKSKGSNIIKEKEKLIESKARGSNLNIGSLTLLLIIFSTSVFCLYSIYLSFPHLQENEKEFIKLPTNIDDAKNLGKVLQKYNQNHYYSVLSAFIFTYIFLQTFAIPGSIFLSILSGFLYPFWMALFLVCFCSSIGASLCYVLSFALARKILLRFLGARLSEWQKIVQNKKSDMLFYMIFLRVTPIVPNWFINLASPLINIPALPFILGTFIGVAPPSCVYIQAGTTLNTLTSATDAFSWQSICVLVLFAILSLLPVFFKNYIRKKIE